MRNSIHTSFTIHFKTNDWYALVKYPELRDQIAVAEKKIISSKNWLSTDKLVSELTLGFWTSLLNKQYAKEFWKPLMYSFPLLDKNLKHRDEISYKLNQIRKFRNRIFHYEPICNDLNLLISNHRKILEALNWINTDVVKWTKNIDRFDGLYMQAVKLCQLK